MNGAFESSKSLVDGRVHISTLTFIIVLISLNITNLYHNGVYPIKDNMHKNNNFDKTSKT
jgi:hypothetical protein